MPPEIMTDIEAQSNGFLQTLRKYWFIIVFFGGLAVTWGTMTAQMDNYNQQQEEQNRRIAVIESKQEDIMEDIASIDRSLARIETSLEFIITQIRNQ